MLQTGTDLVGVPATGGALDWIKQNTRIKYTYVMELPPELTSECKNGINYPLYFFSMVRLPDARALAHPNGERDVGSGQGHSRSNLEGVRLGCSSISE